MDWIGQGFRIGIRFLIHIFLTMKSAKPDTDSIDKSQLVSDYENAISNKDIKKKLSIDSKNKIFQSDAAQMEIKNSTATKFLSEDPSLIVNQEKHNSEKIMNPDDDHTTLKLPVINTRGNKKSSHDSKTDQKLENSDFVKEGKSATSGPATQARNRNSGKNSLSELPESDKVGSFLKFIQIKSMKPTQKVYANRTDAQVREVKMTREEKSIPLRLNRIECESSPSQISRKQSEQKLRIRIRRNEEKSEKVITNYPIRKQKRSISISQKGEASRKKITNSYHDFCNYLCLLNKVQRPITPMATYKAYVGKGNNSILVKNSLKSRFWWNVIDSDNEVNLYWTQCRDQKFVDTLKSYEAVKQQKFQQPQRNSVTFILPKEAKQSTDKNEHIREYTNNGLNRFLSEQQIKQYSKNQYQVQLETQAKLEELGNPNKNKIHNHLQFHWHISNKKALYYNLKKFYVVMKEDPFEYIPLTFHVQKFGDEEWTRFIEAYNDREDDMKKKKEGDKNNKKKKQKNLWIVKPGENSNQGNGIQVFDNIEEIAQMVKNSEERSNGRNRSYIVQRYLMPFLYNKRKFDIRCYVLVTSVKGVYKAYWYEEGYIRTSSKEFTLKNLKNRFIHLTNDAVQKKSEDYGKYENGNKVSFSDFQKYLDNNYPDKDYKFFKSVYPAMIKRASDAIKSTCMLMDAKKRQFTFEIFGLDFMIDEDFATWLIEVNTNPCLELSSPLLARIIPNMVENALKIAVDPLFPPPKQIPKTKSLAMDVFETNKFTLIFNSCEDQEILTNLTKDTNLSNIVESDEEDQNHDDVQ